MSSRNNSEGYTIVEPRLPSKESPHWSVVSPGLLSCVPSSDSPRGQNGQGCPTHASVRQNDIFERVRTGCSIQQDDIKFFAADDTQLPNCKGATVWSTSPLRILHPEHKIFLANDYLGRLDPESGICMQLLLFASEQEHAYKSATLYVNDGQVAGQSRASTHVHINSDDPRILRGVDEHPEIFPWGRPKLTYATSEEQNERFGQDFSDLLSSASDLSKMNGFRYEKDPSVVSFQPANPRTEHERMFALNRDTLADGKTRLARKRALLKAAASYSTKSPISASNLSMHIGTDTDDAHLRVHVNDRSREDGYESIFHEQSLHQKSEAMAAATAAERILDQNEAKSAAERSRAETSSGRSGH